MISDLPAGVALFLRDNVASFEELEALLLLARLAGRVWSTEEIAQSLNVTVDAVDTALSRLVAVGSLVQVVPQHGAQVFRYAPASDEVRARVVELQRAYVEHRFAIVQVMSANAMERIRSSAARRLADAFRFERSRK